MHDPRALLDPATDAVRRLARRGYQLDLDKLGRLLSQRNAAIQEVESARADSKRIAQEVQATAIRTARPRKSCRQRPSAGRTPAS